MPAKAGTRQRLESILDSRVCEIGKFRLKYARLTMLLCHVHPALAI
jgi:hypothetical protein